MPAQATLAALTALAKSIQRMQETLDQILRSVEQKSGKR
jgi:hypothetical protein